MNDFIRKHPILAFLAWFFPVAWGIAFIPFIAHKLSGVELPMEPFIVVANFFGALLPVLVIARVTGQPSRLREQIVKVKAHAGWYALALVVVPAVSLGIAMLAYGAPQVSAATWLNAIAVGFLLQTVIGFATTNLWEEVAWMGFVQARLQSRYGVLAAVLITSLLFMLQHVPLMVVQSMPVFIPVLFFVLVIPFRALMAWIYNRTDSLFLAGLVHAAGDAVVAGTITGVGMLPRLYEGAEVGLFGIAANVIIGLVVIAATRARLAVPARPMARVVAQVAGA